MAIGFVEGEEKQQDQRGESEKNGPPFSRAHFFATWLPDQRIKHSDPPRIC